jgi:methionyl-tRNA formyltransferase
MGQLARNVLETHENVELTVVEGKVAEIRGNFDILFSASYPSKIPQEWCNRAALGAVNIHTSLLPEGRGSHPLNWALIWGRDKTGITVHEITDTYDAGEICLQQEVPIFDTDTIVTLKDRVEWMFPNVIAKFFDAPDYYMTTSVRQNQAHATYAQKRLPEDGEVNEEATPREIYNFVRAHDPLLYPAFVIVDGIKHYVQKAELVDENGEEKCRLIV